LLGQVRGRRRHDQPRAARRAHPEERGQELKAAARRVCFFTPASKFNSRYATFGFNDNANLDEGTMWPTSFALTKLTAADEARISEFVKKAVS
jgi:uncharacterized protein YdhG (YjbR/CyaY superfamily)